LNPGTYYIGYIIDYTDAVSESDEGDNIYLLSRTVTIAQPCEFLITSPASNDELYRDVSYTIIWESTGECSEVVYFTLWDGSYQFTDFGINESNDGSYIWDIPSTAPISDQLRIEIHDFYNNGISVFSDYFAIGESSITWNGTSWSNQTGPSAADNVLFTGDYSNTADAGRTLLEVDNISINSGIKVIIDNEATLDAKGAMENLGQLTIESGASLLTYEGKAVSGNEIVIKRNTRYEGGKYSFVGTPVNQKSEITGQTLGPIVYSYDEVVAYGEDSGLSRWKDAINDVLNPGKGYAQANQKEVVFSGIPNAGTITYTATYTQDLENANEGWSLIANPYATAVDVSDFLSENTNLTGAVYIWDDNGSEQARGSNSDYIVANASGATNNTPAGGSNRFNGYLGSSQGFFVKLDGNGNNTISFTELMRRAGNNTDNNFFRKATDEAHELRVNLTNEYGLFKQALIAQNNEVNDARINKMYDAAIFNINLPYAIYSYKLGEALSIQTISSAIESLPLGINVDEAGTYTISLEDSAFEGEVFLKDGQSGDQVLLSGVPYIFQAKSDQITDRFELLLKRKILGDEVFEDWKIYAFDNELNILPATTQPAARHFKIYSLTGQMIYEATLSRPTAINLAHFSSGVYLLTDDQAIYKFVITKN